jgi:hypothetical protein
VRLTGSIGYTGLETMLQIIMAATDHLVRIMEMLRVENKAVLEETVSTG